MSELNNSQSKNDLGALSEPTKSELRSGIQAAKSEIQNETQNFKTELKSEIYDVRSEMKVYFNKLDNKLDALRPELREDFKKLSLEMEKLNSRVTRLEERAAAKDDVNRILNAIEKFAADMELYRKKDSLRTSMLTEHEDKIKALVNRLSQLEPK